MMMMKKKMRIMGMGSSMVGLVGTGWGVGGGLVLVGGGYWVLILADWVLAGGLVVVSCGWWVLFMMIMRMGS